MPARSRAGILSSCEWDRLPASDCYVSDEALPRQRGSRARMSAGLAISHVTGIPDVACGPARRVDGSMKKLSIEMKARSRDLERVRVILARHNARCVGTDTQTDTYFRVDRGRLKLRQGPIENALIFYQREDRAAARASNLHLVELDAAHAEHVRLLLDQALGVVTVVRKTREIYFIENVKIHLDRLEGLGSFVEIEALQEGGLTEDALHAQVATLMEALAIAPGDIEPRSYADLVAVS